MEGLGTSARGIIHSRRPSQFVGNSLGNRDSSRGQSPVLPVKFDFALCGTGLPRGSILFRDGTPSIQEVNSIISGFSNRRISSNDNAINLPAIKPSPKRSYFGTPQRPQDPTLKSSFLKKSQLRPQQFTDRRHSNFTGLTNASPKLIRDPETDSNNNEISFL